LGNCFVIIDEALNQLCGEKPQHYSDTDIDALRAIIYMLRCAIAHSPTAPVWKAKGSFYRSFKISEIGYELDGRTLDGRGVEHKDYGGLVGAISLIDHSLKIVKKYSKSE